MFFTLRENGSFKNRSLKGSLGNQNWFFYAMASHISHTMEVNGTAPEGELRYTLHIKAPKRVFTVMP